MNSRGSIVMICLWIVMLLVLFAIGVGHRAALGVRLAGYQRERVKATYCAAAGVYKAVAELIKDTNVFDALSETWSTGRDPQSGDLLFEQVPIASEPAAATYTVRYLFDASQDDYLCMQDEERRLSLNRVDVFGKEQKRAFLRSLGWREDDASRLIDLLLDWIDTDTTTSLGGIEDDACKNGPFTVPQEVAAFLEHFYRKENEKELAAKVQQLYNTFADRFSVFSDGKVNLNTVDSETGMILIAGLLKALTVPGVTENDPNVLAQRIQAFREEGGVFDKADAADIKNKLNISGSELSIGEENIITQLLAQGLVGVSSRSFRVISEGKAGLGVSVQVTAVIRRSEGGEVIYWHEG